MAEGGWTPVAQEISEWLKQIRESWFGELPKALWLPYRFGFAAAGALVFAIYHAVPQPGTRLLTQEASVSLGTAIMRDWSFALYLGSAVLVVGTGILVAWRDRKSGPIRLFFDGILIPTGAALLLGLGR